MTVIYHHCIVFRYVFMRAEFIFLFFINIVLVGISNQIDIPPQNPKFHIPNLRRLYFLGFRVCRVYPNENGAGEKTALNILLVSSLYALKSRPVWLSFQCVCTCAYVCVCVPSSQGVVLFQCQAYMFDEHLLHLLYNVCHRQKVSLQRHGFPAETDTLILI